MDVRFVNFGVNELTSLGRSVGLAKSKGGVKIHLLAITGENQNGKTFHYKDGNKPSQNSKALHV